MDHIGIDVHKTSSQVCILTGDGELIERRIKTTRESFGQLLGARLPARILIEASTESEWVAQCLEGLGHEVVVADPNFAPMYATRDKKIKTDKRDARTLCEACRLGAYRPAHRTSERQRRVRAQISVREALVRTRSRYISLIGALCRREGLRLLTGSPEAFITRVEQAELPECLRAEIEPLLQVMRAVDEQIKQADRRLAEIVKEDQDVRRLCTAPGVGPVTAVTLAATLDSARRFSGAKQVRCYLGLVPREQSSGERQRRGKISKAGNKRARSLLVEAAWTIMRSQRTETEVLRAWAAKVASRRGKRIAAVALARRLAGILYAMWRDETEFDPQLLSANVVSGQRMAA